MHLRPIGHRRDGRPIYAHEPVAYFRDGRPIWPIAGGDGTEEAPPPGEAGDSSAERAAGEADTSPALGGPTDDELRASAERDGEPWDRAPRDSLVRALPDAPELRAEGTDDGGVTMYGHFAVFDTWTEIRSLWEGNFMESIARGAFKRTFAQLGKRIRVLLEHGRDPQAGNKPLGLPDDLGEDDTGARYESKLFTEADYVRAIVPALRAGAYGSSFRFSVVKEEWNKKPPESDHNPKGLPERVLRELAVPEFGPVTFPAYDTATAGARSLTDDYLLWRLGLEPERLAEHLEHLRGRGTSHAAPGPGTRHSGETVLPSRLATRGQAPSQAAFIAAISTRS